MPGTPGFKIGVLRSQHFIAATLFACGYTLQDISSAVHLGKSHLYTLQNSPLFQKEVERIKVQLQSRLINSAADVLQGEALASVSTLIAIRDDLNLSPTVRLRAADSILDRVAQTSKANRLIDATPAAPQLTDAQITRMLETLNTDSLAASAARSVLDIIDLVPETSPSV